MVPRHVPATLLAATEAAGSSVDEVAPTPAQPAASVSTAKIDRSATSLLGSMRWVLPCLEAGPRGVATWSPSRPWDEVRGKPVADPAGLSAACKPSTRPESRGPDGALQGALRTGAAPSKLQILAQNRPASAPPAASALPSTRTVSGRAPRWARPRSAGPVRMPGDPVTSDIDAPADPDAVVPGDVIEEASQRRGAAGPAHQTHVQPHRHHPRVLGALGVQHDERVAHVAQ